jgi:hypothetical protein
MFSYEKISKIVGVIYDYIGLTGGFIENKSI